MATALMLALIPCLLAITVLIHYEVLRLTGACLPRLQVRPRQRILIVIAACLIAHLLEVVLYAAVLALLVLFPAFGSIGGEFNGAVADFLYFSLTCYTTLGIGDIHPLGPLRLIVGVESLNGLLLITWSASFCYLNMQEDWHPNTDDQE
jgi:hypothetical protein